MMVVLLIVEGKMYGCCPDVIRYQALSFTRRWRQATVAGPKPLRGLARRKMQQFVWRADAGAAACPNRRRNFLRFVASAFGQYDVPHAPTGGTPFFDCFIFFASRLAVFHIVAKRPGAGFASRAIDEGRAADGARARCRTSHQRTPGMGESSGIARGAARRA
ncbi:hypothetical protein [Burkholderia thailandensis]|uniref:hypothetical protein n=1 Tax=Burkholderia thailandensis TaxID=57975 RepID=UPI001868EC14|nr:hypothetical protein [Burkholderia thailandensis]MCS3398973.1 hypothetical protein [Burkholderia thailandensis]MCS6513231.1 hypothetical protein [Burkholderia thailandensis]